MKLKIKMLSPLFLVLFIGLKSFGQDTKQVVKISNIGKRKVIYTLDGIMIQSLLE